MGPGFYKEPTLLWFSLVGCAGAFLLVLLLLGPSAVSAFFACSLSALFPITWMLARQQACQELKQLRQDTGLLRAKAHELEETIRRLGDDLVERDRREDSLCAVLGIERPAGGLDPATLVDVLVTEVITEADSEIFPRHSLEGRRRRRRRRMQQL